MKLKNEKEKAIYLQKVVYLEKLFNSFLDGCKNLNEDAFISKTGRVNISMYEAIFAAVCRDAYQNNNLEVATITQDKLDVLKNNPEFIRTTISDTTSKDNVGNRLRLAKQILLN